MPTEDKETKNKSKPLSATKQKQARKSFVPPELVVQPNEKKHKPTAPIIKSSIAFPTDEYRLMITKTYKKYGFTNMKSYIMSLIDISIENENVAQQLMEKAISLKKR
jgi:hypothetical protein